MAGHTPIPVEKQGGLIMLETIIHRKGEGFGVPMIRMGIMRILIDRSVTLCVDLAGH
jgi:hypothetical protein